MNHHQEYKKFGTICGWSVEEVESGEAPESVKLIWKDIQGKTTLQEKIVIEIQNLLLYNNVDYISENEISETADKIIKLFQGKGKGKGKEK